MDYIENLILYDFKNYTNTFQIEFYKRSDIELERINQIQTSFSMNENKLKKEPKSLQTNATRLGNTLLIIMNEYEQIIKYLEESKNYILNLSFEEKTNTNIYTYDEDYDFNEPIYYDIFQQLKIDIQDTLQKRKYEPLTKDNKNARKYKIQKDISPILLNEINTFENTLHQIRVDYFNELDNKIRELAKLEKSIINKKVAQQYKDLKNGTIIKNACIKFLDNFINDLKEIKKLVDNSFLNKSVESNTKKFKLNQITIPTSTFQFNLTDKNPKIKRYTYTFNNIQELCYITFYQLLINKKVISKCEFCNDYFIPKNRNDEIYCDKKYKKYKGEETSCAKKGKYKKYNINRKNDIDSLYGNLLNRLNGKIKDNDTNYNTYCELKEKLRKEKEKINKQKNEDTNKILKQKLSQKILSKKLKEIEKKYDKEFHIYLTSFDKDYQNKFPRRNKNKYTSNKYWYRECKIGCVK